MIRIAKKLAAGTPPVDSYIIYVDVEGVPRIKDSTGSEFRIGAGITPKLIPFGMNLLVPTNHQLINIGGMTIDGTLTVDGDVIIL